MVSTIAWLDASREDQRRIREVLNLFAQHESRDELGVGQVRDAFSDRLFPGTSTLHTRARYLLLIPWCYRAAAGRARTTQELEAGAAKNERLLIVALNSAGATQGLIGRIALTKLKTLPSSLYWSALNQYGVLVGDVADELARRSWSAEAEELVERKPRMWDVPPLPEGFPELEARLDLSTDEAAWVKERLLHGSRGSLLEVLLKEADPALLQLDYAWQVPTQDDDLTAIREHARLFSLVVQGAALTYNRALAQRYEHKGYDAVENPTEVYDERLREWIAEAAPDARAVAAWDLPDLWARVREQNPNLSWTTRRFVEDWVDLLRAGVSPDRPEAAALVTARERAVKRKQSRLDNEKLLRSWSGASGTGRLTYRWSNVQRLVGDVLEGQHHAGS